MTGQDITPYLNWTKNLLRTDEQPAVAKTLGSTEWSLCFSATAARIDRFLQLGHEGSKTLPSSLVLDVIELDKSWLTDVLDDEGLLKNFVYFWSAIVDVYGGPATSSQTEAKRLDLLVEWSLLLTALPGSNYPAMKQLARRYQHERARLALTKLHKADLNFAHAAMGLNLVQDHEAALGLRWDMQLAAFTRAGETKDENVKRAQRPRNEGLGELLEPERDYLGASSIFCTLERPVLKLELHGNWRDHWTNTLP